MRPLPSEGGHPVRRALPADAHPPSGADTSRGKDARKSRRRICNISESGGTQMQHGGRLIPLSWVKQKSEPQRRKDAKEKHALQELFPRLSFCLCVFAPLRFNFFPDLHRAPDSCPHFLRCYLFRQGCSVLLGIQPVTSQGCVAFRKKDRITTETQRTQRRR